MTWMLVDACDVLYNVWCESDHIIAVISPTILIIQQGSNVIGLNLVDSDDRLLPSMSIRAGFKGDAELGELIYTTQRFPLRWCANARDSTSQHQWVSVAR